MHYILLGKLPQNTYGFVIKVVAMSGKVDNGSEKAHALLSSFEATMTLRHCPSCIHTFKLPTFDLE